MDEREKFTSGEVAVLEKELGGLVYSTTHPRRPEMAREDKGEYTEEKVEQKNGLIVKFCYIAQEEVKLIEGIEKEIEGLTVEVGLINSERCPEGYVSITFIGGKEIFWPFVWRAVNERLAQKQR